MFACPKRVLIVLKLVISRRDINDENAPHVSWFQFGLQALPINLFPESYNSSRRIVRYSHYGLASLLFYTMSAMICRSTERPKSGVVR